MNFDGAGDSPSHQFSLDGNSSPSNERSMYDDRLPLFRNFGNGFRPPPPLSSHRQPYAETDSSYEASPSRNRHNTHSAQNAPPQAIIAHHTQLRSRYTESVSPGARHTSDFPLSGFQYGSGPIPRDEEPFHERATDAGISKVPFQDTVWLNKVIKTAVKQGVEESRLMEAQSGGHAANKKSHSNVDTKNHLPGAWPASPVAATPKPYTRPEPAAFSVREHESNHSSDWNDSKNGWGQHKSRSRAGTRVTWNAEPLSETGSSSHNGWKIHEHAPSDSWDTEETWATDKVHNWEAADPLSKSQAPAVLSHYNVKAIPPTLDTYDHQRSKHSSQGQKSRSKSRTKHSRRESEGTSSSSEETGYAYLERPSDSVVSLSSSNETPRASHSRSHVLLKTKSRSKSRSRRTRSVPQNNGRRSSQASHCVPISQPAEIHTATPPMVTQVTPTVMNLPVHLVPTQMPPQQPSVYVEPDAQVVLPPNRDSEVLDPTRKQSIASNLFPPPYALTLDDLVHSTVGMKEPKGRSTFSSTWGSVKKSESAKGSWGDDTENKSGWGNTGESGWGEKEPEPQDKNGWETTNEATKDGLTNGWTKTDNDKQVKASAWDIEDNGWGIKKDRANLKNTVSNVENIGGSVDDNGWGMNESGWDTKSDWGSPQTSKNTEKEGKGGIANDVASLRSASINTTQKPPVSDVPWQTQTWDFQTSNDKEKAVPCDNIKPVPPTTAAEPPKEAASISRRHSNKSLSKYRQLRTPSADLCTPKPHWQFPPPPPSHKLWTICEDQTYVAPKEPRYTIPEKIASEKGIEHQVRPGPATEYGHAMGRPEYMDRLDNPYAVFRFKYRSRSILKALFGDQIPAQEQPALAPTTDIKEKLKQMPQDELIDKMLELETKLKKVKKSGEKKHKHEQRHHDREKQKEKERRPSDRTEVMAKALTEAWVQQHSRGPSEKAKSQTKGLISK